MKIILSFIFSFLCFFTIAQASDSLQTKVDSIPKVKEKWFKISGFRAGVDLVPLIAYPLFNEGRNGFEALLEVSLRKKYFLEAAIGIDNLKTEEQGGLYQFEMQGGYLRLGFHHNLLFKDEDDFLDVVSIGGNLGTAVFSQNLNYDLIDPFWGRQNITNNSPNLTALWVGLNFGIRVETFKNLFLGWNATLKVRLYASDTEVGVGRIPGFGVNDDGYNFGIGYVIMYQIPFSKRQEIPQDE